MNLDLCNACIRLKENSPQCTDIKVNLLLKVKLIQVKLDPEQHCFSCFNISHPSSCLVLKNLRFFLENFAGLFQFKMTKVLNIKWFRSTYKRLKNEFSREVDNNICINTNCLKLNAQNLCLELEKYLKYFDFRIQLEEIWSLLKTPLLANPWQVEINDENYL